MAAEGSGQTDLQQKIRKYISKAAPSVLSGDAAALTAALDTKEATEILNRIDGAVQKGTIGAREAAVVVQVRAEDAARELRARKERGE